MYIERLVVGALETNCYVVACQKTREGVVIDPGADADLVVRAVRASGVSVRYIINTHGHADHVAGNRGVQEGTGAQIAIHEADAKLLANPLGNLSLFTGRVIVSPSPGRLLQEGDEVEFGKVRLKVIHTPGHTPGGICLAGGEVVFTGDTLFAGSVGRTDLPGGSYATLMKSIKEKLVGLDDGVRVFPGHGPLTTMGEEKRSNPFLC